MIKLNIEKFVIREKVSVFLFALCCAVTARADSPLLSHYLNTYCEQCASRSLTQSGVYILEKGEEALMSRAWLAGHAGESIDIQYFIWSTDNIGILAIENLLSAAERGVRVRVVVDDLLVDAKEEHLVGLNAHPNVAIKLYNPKHSVGVPAWRKYWYLLTDFRGSNQRMHDKTAIFDGIAGITGGRNMADEYFDYDQAYNFRDRDVLLVGKAVSEMQANFEEFWNSELSIGVAELLDPNGKMLNALDLDAYYKELHAYARDPEHFAPEVRQALNRVSDIVPAIVSSLRWSDAVFISDAPGKNAGDQGLRGGGETTAALVDAVRNAKESIWIQSPYLVVPEGGQELFAALVDQGVNVKISTNSLASTDNLYAFSGYRGQRDELLEAGVEIYEYKPEPAIQAELISRYQRLAKNKPVFALHAKTLVIDDETVYIGTFNLDPRSANLNTEVGILTKDPVLARQVVQAIARDIHPDNSWRITEDFNPDGRVSFLKRLKVFGFGLLPLEPLL